MADVPTTRALCRTCHQSTKHVVLCVRKTEDSSEIEDYGPVSWEDTYEMLECCGCETVTLRHSSLFSELPDATVHYYPPPASRPVPAWRNELTGPLRSLMEEVYSALYCDNRRLALMGARAAVDVVLQDKVGDSGTFSQRLQELEALGFVGQRSREFLAAALDAGHAAVHRGFEPETEQLAHVMDIVENVVQAVYVLEDAAAALRDATPRRRK